MVLKRLFGEKCVRCGEKRTKNEHEGLPTCNQCVLQLQADDEESRLCPDCSVAMNKLVVLNVVADKCPGCGGVWLDPGELELIQKHAGNLEEQFVTGMMVGMATG